MALITPTGSDVHCLNCSNVSTVYQLMYHVSNHNNNVLNIDGNVTDDTDMYEEGFFYENIEDLKKPWVAEPHFIPLVLIYGTVFLLGISGNGLVIFAIFGAKHNRSVTFNFMASLAVADLLFLLVVVPHETLRMVLGDWSGGRVFCKFSGFIEMLTAVASIANLTAVSFERYFVIVMPMRSRRNCTLGKTRRILVFVWLLAIGLASPAVYTRDTELMTYYNNDSSVTLMFCADNGIQHNEMLPYFIYQLLIMFVLPTCLMVYCYAVVIYALWISSRRLLNMTANNRDQSPVNYNSKSPSPNSGITSSRNIVRSPAPTRIQTYNPGTRNCEVTDAILKGRKQVIKMLITVIIVFLVCWGPKLVFQIIKYTNRNTIWTTFFFKLQIAIYCLPYIQSCLNPIIYGFMSKNFRRNFKTAWNCHVRKIAQYRGPRSHHVTEFDMECKYSSGTMLTKVARNSGSSDL